MKKWIKGDLHVHSHNCKDGHLPIMEIVERAREYCDFMAISGHAYDEPDCGERQYQEILEARKRFPEMPIFHTAEQEFPVERHTMFLTLPENREFELQRELIKRYHRKNGVVGIEKAEEELAFVEKNWGKNVFMIFNHPNAPDVSLENLGRLSKASDIFKVIACVDRRERRAKQTWDIGGEWDQLLSLGYRLFARCGSDFHNHFTDGGDDYLPGEFVQDHLWVEDNSYMEIIKAYRTGQFFCTVDNCIHSPVFECSNTSSTDFCNIKLQLTAEWELAQIDIVSDGKSIKSFKNIYGEFKFEGILPRGRYYRVRGAGKLKARKYTDGEFQPMFLLNPIFTERK